MDQMERRKYKLIEIIFHSILKIYFLFVNMSVVVKININVERFLL